MFDNRTIGRSIEPRPSTMFGGAIQNSRSGNFLSGGRPDGAAAFSTPWRRGVVGMVEPTVGEVLAAPLAVPQLMPSTQPFVPVYSLRELPATPEVAPPPANEMNEPEGAGPAEQGLGPAEQGLNPAEEGVGPMEQGLGPAVQGIEAASAVVPAVSAVTVPSVRLRAAFPSPAGSQPYTRSPELSERLTRIARDKGMLSGQGIDVYLVGNRVARLQGTVRTSGDRALLANVVGLEPEVYQVDNRLVVEGAATVSPNHKRP